MRARRAKRIEQHLQNLHHPDNDVSNRAEQLLVRHYAIDVRPRLLSMCRDSNPQARWRAAYILAKSGSADAFHAIQPLLQDEDSAVRYEAAMALGYLRDERAIPQLIPLMLVSDDDGCLDSAAAMSVAMFGDAARPLLEPLRGHPMVDDMLDRE